MDDPELIQVLGKMANVCIVVTKQRGKDLEREKVKPLWELAESSGLAQVYMRGAIRTEPLGRTAWSHPKTPAHDRGVRLLVPVQEGRHCGSSSIARRETTKSGQVGEDPATEGLCRILLGPALGRFGPSVGGE
jgi:hypothetical protein